MKPIMAWKVRPGEGQIVGEIVDKMVALGAPELAVVFVNGRRCRLADKVEADDLVQLYPRREAEKDAVQILAKRDGVFMIDKPAGLPTETTQQGADSLVNKLFIQLKGGRLHAASRLDVSVSGVVLGTLGRDAARRVQDARDAGQLSRLYIAIALSKEPLPKQGKWQWALGRRRDRGGRVKAARNGRDLKSALTNYRVLAIAGEAQLLALRPETGRFHQLRAHASFAGAPLLGDGRYGGARQVHAENGRMLAVERVALHALRVQLPGLTGKAPLPPEFAEWWCCFGGTVDALSMAALLHEPDEGSAEEPTDARS